jgi:hypothetical protein
MGMPIFYLKLPVKHFATGKNLQVEKRQYPGISPWGHLNFINFFSPLCSRLFIDLCHPGACIFWIVTWYIFIELVKLWHYKILTWYPFKKIYFLKFAKLCFFHKNIYGQVRSYGCWTNNNVFLEEVVNTLCISKWSSEYMYNVTSRNNVYGQNFTRLGKARYFRFFFCFSFSWATKGINYKYQFLYKLI